MNLCGTIPAVMGGLKIEASTPMSPSQQQSSHSPSDFKYFWSRRDEFFEADPVMLAISKTVPTLHAPNTSFPLGSSSFSGPIYLSVCSSHQKNAWFWEMLNPGDHSTLIIKPCYSSPGKLQTETRDWEHLQYTRRQCDTLLNETCAQLPHLDCRVAWNLVDDPVSQRSPRRKKSLEFPHKDLPLSSWF